jgi:hypothetical protein
MTGRWTGECSPRALESTSWKTDPRTPRGVVLNSHRIVPRGLSARRSDRSRHRDIVAASLRNGH